MSSFVVAELAPVGEARIALEHVKVEAGLRGLCSETLMTQGYRNLEDRNIEAVYTFPLPVDAVLLELTLELNGKVLKGVVTAKKEAEERYEDALESGDAAVLLRQVEPGIYSVSVGSIMPGERVLIRYRYSQLYHWQGDSLRFQLPTTIAPRYGDPLASGMAMHEVPGYSLTVDHGFALELRIEGALARADFECPSHPIGINDDHASRVFSLAGGSSLMDRDFVLILKQPNRAETEGYWAKDKEEVVALASFHPCYPGEPDVQPKVVNLVVDCSGSMAGNSMRQAKVAVREILSSLNNNDLFNVTTFGGHHRLLFSRPKPVNRHNLQVAREFISQTDANMGGTEIGTALLATYKARANAEASADILLITDGEIWEQEAIINDAKQSGHRIFSVGVGSAVSEGFVREIAEVSGGASELVSPRENMAEHIVRHFQRIHEPRATVIEVDWPGEVHYQSPEVIKGVYSGDTLHLFARLDAAPSVPVVLRVGYEGGRQVEHSLTLLPADEPTGFQATLPRLAASARLESLNDEEAQSLAVQYQLVTHQTSCVLVYERDEDEKAEDAPELRKVPQMLAAGWGGLGSVDAGVPMDVADSPLHYCAIPVSADRDYLDRPAFLRRQPDDGPDQNSRMRSGKRERQELIGILDAVPFGTLETLRSNGIRTIGDLLALTEKALLALDGIDEADVVEIVACLTSKGWHLKKKGIAETLTSVFQR